MIGFFSPAVQLMNRLRYKGRLLMTGGLAFVAIAILLVSLALHIYESVDSTRQELAAVELIGAVHHQIKETQQHRGISAAFLSGDTSLLPKLEAKGSDVEQSLRVVEQMLSRHAFLHDQRPELQAIRSEWAHLQRDVRGMTTDQTLRTHGRLIERLLRYQANISDKGTLTLDNELHTYYLAATLYRSLPEMLERLGKMRAKGTGILVRKTMSLEDRVEFAVHNQILKATLAALKQDLEKAGHHSPAIQPRLDSFSDELGGAIALALGLLELDVLGGRFRATPVEFFDQFTLAIDIGYREMFDTLLPTLNQQLEDRIERLHRQLALEGAAAALVLLLLTYASIGAYYSIIESVRRLSAGAATLAAGDLATTIHLAGQDELSEVATSFNTMAEALGKLLHDSQQTAIELSVALEAAKLADQTKDAFLANVSHELRTPLNAVIGLAELARHAGCPAEKQREYLLKIADAGRTLSSIINDLLDLSKIAAGRMELDPVTFSMTQLVARVHSIMSFKLSEKGLELRDQLSADIPAALVGDNLRIEQVLLNLLSNAIKFTHEGYVELRVSVSAREAHRVCLLIEVEDTGIGMTEEETARLFQPFSQADASMSRKYGGTGLGLALCKRIAEMMEGGVGVRSRQGQGTTFTISLRLALGDVANLVVEQSVHDHETDPVHYQDVRILVVDDQPINREIVCELLSSVGVTVWQAENGQQALDIIFAEEPVLFDAVLMDVQMPVMDGLEATRLLRTHREFDALPVIAMTAHTMEHEKQISAAAGMIDHIGKPFETREFFRVLRQWILRHKQVSAATESTSTAVVEEKQAAAPSSLTDRLAAIAGLDAAAGMTRFNNKEDRYIKWLVEFTQTAREVPLKLRTQLADGHLEEAVRGVHSFKGRAGVLGMDALHAQIVELELALRDSQPAEMLISRVDQSICTMCDALHRILLSEA